MILLKQQSTGKHVSPLGHIIMILLKQQSTGKHVSLDSGTLL